jgi:hypothetical protein
MASTAATSIRHAVSGEPTASSLAPAHASASTDRGTCGPASPKVSMLCPTRRMPTIMPAAKWKCPSEERVAHNRFWRGMNQPGARRVVACARFKTGCTGKDEIRHAIILGHGTQCHAANSMLERYACNNICDTANFMERERGLANELRADILLDCWLGYHHVKHLARLVRARLGLCGGLIRRGPASCRCCR